MKNLTQIVPDFRVALEEGVQEAAEQVVFDLKRAGPYWTGFFESLWQVNAGNIAVKPNIKDATTNKKKRPGRDYTEAEVPESPKLGGYTIGNRANYRAYAMDILPSPTGRQGGNAKNKTAPKNWYDTYINSKMRTVVNKSIQNVFRRYS